MPKSEDEVESILTNVNINIAFCQVDN